jgi:hypothetical protein
MALTNKSRTAIYSGLTDIIDEDAVEEMLTNFPARETVEPVTRDFLAAQMSQMRAEMAQIRAEMARMESRIQDRFATQTRWMVGMMIAVPAVTVALQAFIK